MAAVLGLTASPHLGAAGVATLVADTRAKATDHRAACSAVVSKLGEHVRRVGLEPGAISREQTALAALRFIEAIHAAKDDDVVPAVARARLATSTATTAKSIAKAQAVADALNGAKFDLIDAAAGLAAALRAAETDAARLLATTPRAPSPAAPAASATATAPVAPAVAASRRCGHRGRRVVERSKRDDLDPAKAKEVLEAIQRRLRERPGRQLTLEWRIDEPEGNA